MPPSAHVVLFFSHRFSLGEWVGYGILDRELALYRALARRGVEVTLLTYGGPEEAEHADRLPEFRVLYNHWGLPPERYEQLLPLLHGPDLARADVFKTNQIRGAAVAIRAARLWRKPLIARCGYLWSRFQTLQHGADSEQALSSLAQETKAFRAAARVVVTTETMRADVGARLPDVHERITVIPNYVDMDLFRPRPQADGTMARYDVVYVGRLEPQKNLDAFLTAVRALGLRVLLIGKGQLRERLEQEYGGANEGLTWMGQVPATELPELLGQATLFALPAHYEGHPKVILEAMACGLPVLGTKVRGIQDLVEHGNTGYLTGTSAEELQAGLTLLLNDEGLRRRLAASGRAFVKERFDLDQIVERELAVYEELVPEDREPERGGLLGALRQGLDRIPGTGFIQRLSRPLMRSELSRLSTTALVRFLKTVITKRARDLPPGPALRFLLQLESVTESLLGERAQEYDGGIHPRHRVTRHQEFFVARVPPEASVLILGVGDGTLAYRLAQLTQARITAVDPSRGVLERARAQFAHEAILLRPQITVEDVPDGPFQVVIVDGALGRTGDAVRYLREVLGRCQPERLLLRVAWSERDWRIPLRRELGLGSAQASEGAELSLEELQDILGQAGLELTEHEAHFGDLFVEALPVAGAVAE